MWGIVVVVLVVLAVIVTLWNGLGRGSTPPLWLAVALLCAVEVIKLVAGSHG